MSGFRVPLLPSQPSTTYHASPRLGVLSALVAATLLVTATAMPSRVGAKASHSTAVAPLGLAAARADNDFSSHRGVAARDKIDPLLAPGIEVDWVFSQRQSWLRGVRNDVGQKHSAGLWDVGVLTASDAFRSLQSGQPARSTAPQLQPKSLRNSRAPSLFGSVALKTSSATLRETIGNALSEASWPASAQCSSGTQAPCNMPIPANWASFIEELRGMATEEVIRRVNAEVNSRIRYVNDLEAFGAREYWAGPAETLRRAAGDCEDFAIVKMWLLNQIGLALEDMHIVVVRGPQLPSNHAVLAVQALGQNFILDNLKSHVRLAAQVKDYVPVYSTNAQGIWLHAFPAERSYAIARN